MHCHKILYRLLLCSFLLIACKQTKHDLKRKSVTKPLFIAIQPLAFTDTQQLHELKTQIETYYYFKVIILPNIALPPQAFYKPRNRYRADSLIRFLKDKPTNTDYIIGITAKDISSTKGDFPDFGIMGLGYRPGKSCVVSTFRIKTPNPQLLKERLAKVALHEIGHNVGLPHCTTKDCFMHDGEASIKQVDSEKLDLCNNCKKKIGL